MMTLAMYVVADNQSAHTVVRILTVIESVFLIGLASPEELTRTKSGGTVHIYNIALTVEDSSWPKRYSGSVDWACFESCKRETTLEPPSDCNRSIPFVPGFGQYPQAV